MPVSVAEPNGIAVTQHDVIGACAPVYRLVEVVTHRVRVRELLEIRHIAALHVVEPKGGGAFAGGLRLRGILGAEIGWLWQAVGARSHRDFNPGEQAAVAAGRTLRRGVLQRAVQLLPHLVEAVDGTRSVGVVNKALAVSQLKGPRGQRIDLCDTRIWRLGRKA